MSGSIMARAVPRHAAMIRLQAFTRGMHDPMVKATCRNLSTVPTTLPWKLGRYDAVEMDLRGMQRMDNHEFEHQLQALVAEWQQTGKAGVWIRCDISQGSLLSAASNCGFEFHNAEGKTAVLHKWLRTGKSPVPLYATHHVGVGAIVLDDQRRLLLVREAGKHSHKAWKIPTGRADLGEDIHDAASREVLEETGIKTVFASVLAFRQQHNPPAITHGRSDFFVLFRMKPLTSDINLDPAEIADCTWMDVDEFIQTTEHPLNKWAARIAIKEVALEQAAPSSLSQCEVLDLAAKQAHSSMIKELVYVPVTKRSVHIYRSSTAPAILA